MNNAKHSIKANLYLNMLTDSPNDYMARVLSEKTLNVADICQAAVTRGGAPSTSDAMMHNVNLFLKEMAYQLSDGFSVNTGYFTASAHIKGVFDSAKETFNPAKHSVLFQFNQGDLLRKELGDVDVKIMGVADTGIIITEILDVKSGSVNDRVTPNRNLRIRGNKLKVAGEHPLVGIRFVNQMTGDAIAVDASDVVDNKPSELVIVVPPLEPGQYTLEVGSQYSVGKELLREPRTTVFDRILTVQ